MGSPGAETSGTQLTRYVVLFDVWDFELRINTEFMP